MSHQHQSHSHGHPAHETHSAADYEHELVEHDSWFRHDTAEPQHQASHGETSAIGILLTLFATVVFVFGTGGVVLVWFGHEWREFAIVQEEQKTNVTDLRNARAEWERVLSSYEWADPATGRVRIPLELAKSRVIDRYAGGSAPAPGRTPSR